MESNSKAGTAAGGLRVQYELFEDGQKPGNTKEPQRLAVITGKQSTDFLAVFDNILPPLWCDRAYTYALSREGRPFGVYILTESEALNTDCDAEALWQTGQHQRALALVVTRALVFERGAGFLQKDVPHIHGTAVWCLSSGLTNSVQYHIDYAELFRYETNTILPPLYAGTVQVSPLGLRAGDLEGGAFCANMEGLAHYRRYGYKGRLVQQQQQQQAQAQAQSPAGTSGGVGVGGVEQISGSGSSSSSSSSGGGDYEKKMGECSPSLIDNLRTDPAWHTVRYRQNRGILHDGDLPHLSTPITEIAEGRRRVIFGLNCFSAEVGDCCVRAPEHSDAFNRTVKLYQALSGAGSSGGGGGKYAGQGQGQDNSSNGAGVGTGAGVHPPTAPDQTPAAATAAAAASADSGKIRSGDVLKNPALAKLLVLAARKVKQHQAETGEDFVALAAKARTEASRLSR